MKKQIKYLLGLVVAVLTLFTACMEDDLGIRADLQASHKINLSGEITQVYQTRVNDDGFCNGDEIGVYIVDYDGTTAGELRDEGNRADNIKHTFDEASYKWNAARDIYWKDDKTPVDIYGYYPFSSPSSVSAYTFEVQKDQSTTTVKGKMGGYEASDFLWGKVENIAATEQVVKLGFRHMMASSRVTLAEGTGFDEGEWASVDKSVLMLNTKRESTINLATGEVTATGDVPATGIIPYMHGDDFRAIVIPQSVSANTPLVSITMDGTPYLFKRSEDFTYIPTKQHNFTITVNKREGSGYEFELTSESITAWENDNISHDATAREYIVIHVEEPGTLEEAIVAAGKDVAKVQNLKVTGNINNMDFFAMNYKMERLRALNLKEVVIVKGDLTYNVSGGKYHSYAHDDYEIPKEALQNKVTLISLVLPDKLEHIGDRAFQNCTNLSGSLILPEGLVTLGESSFMDCRNLTGVLQLPSTLKKIGPFLGYQTLPHNTGAFNGCGFVGELKIPDGVTEIGSGAFYNCAGLYGELRLPGKLEKIGGGAFYGCLNMSGSIEIPQGVTIVPEKCFSNSGFNGVLTLHDGITAIGLAAFEHTPLKGELRLPKDLEVISSFIFNGCDFSGKLVLPTGLYTIGDMSFAYNWRLMGNIEIPENVISIGAGAFAHCSSIEGVIFPKDLEAIRYEPTYRENGGAFEGCYGIGKIVCKGTIPSYVQNGAFNGVPKDNFTLEVPEAAIQQYQTATGWKDFKRISAYRNLAIRPNIATAINTSVTRDLVLNADDEWEVESKPDWITLDQTSGKGKTELGLTFTEMSKGSMDREGEVVFKLKEKDYRTRCKITQYNYEYAEDQIVTLQTATKGNGINLVFLGDGYDAKDVSEGKYLKNIKEGIEHYFSIEPYKTYRNYFNVYTGIAVSPESGIGGINTIIYNRFNTTFKGGVGLGGRNSDDSDYDRIFEYACKAPTVNVGNIDQTLVVMIPNTTDYGGICYMWSDNSAIAYCPMSDYGYPFDFRGLIQHEAGGHGFGKLGDEYIYHNAFIDNCGCSCCEHEEAIIAAHSLGWYQNLSLTGKMNAVPWSHFIFHEKYNQVVDIFEGGFMHARGVYRSEQTSCMNNNVPYYSTISREAMVKRIKAYAGETYSFAEFVANDVMDAATVTTRSEIPETISRAPIYRRPPVMMGKRPKLNVNN